MRLRLETAAGDSVEIEDGFIVAATVRPPTRQASFPPARSDISRHPRAAARDPDVVVQTGPGTLLPGLINAHDHLHRNHYPRLGSPPYEDAYAWGTDLHARFAGEIAHAKTLDRRDALLFGALKNILGGVTTVVHHDAWEPAFDDEFPIRVVRMRSAHSLGFDADGVAALSQVDAGTRQQPFCIHLAEGVNARAAGEVAALRAHGLLDERLIAVHAVGVDADGIDSLRAAGAAVVWCPTSNHFLLGRTAPRALVANGLDILLGTDALLTADGTMLDELRAAAAAGYLDEHALHAAVGSTAACRLGMPEPSLRPGSHADLVLLRRPLLEATPRDVALVLVAGRPVLADPSLETLFDAPSGRTGTIVVGGERKLIADPLADVAARVVAHSPACGRIFD